MKITPIFPTPFASENIGNIVDKFEINSILTLSKEKNNYILNSGSNMNYFHKNTYILDLSPLLKKIVLEKVNFFIRDILGETDSSLKITQSWININPTGATHHQHSHINSIISGVLYLYVDEFTGNFLVHKNTNSVTVGNNIEKYNDFTYEYIYFTPTNMDLYIFPSYLKHSVEENKSSKERISLSFNTFYNCELDKFNYLTKLDLS
jgi:uncharacterized protein (TIGR02466 family)